MTVEAQAAVATNFDTAARVGEEVKILETALDSVVAIALVEEAPGEIQENYIGAKRLGPYWNTPPYRSVIQFEGWLSRVLRNLVDTRELQLQELSDFLERYHSRSLIERPCRDSNVSSLVMRLRHFLVRARQLFGRGTVDSWTDEVLGRIRERARTGRRLWDDPAYWSNTVWVVDASAV